MILFEIRGAWVCRKNDVGKSWYEFQLWISAGTDADTNYRLLLLLLQIFGRNIYQSMFYMLASYPVNNNNKNMREDWQRPVLPFTNMV